MKHGRSGQTEVWPPKRTKASAEGFHGTLEGWERLLEIAGDHDWFTFNARVERQKPWLGDFGELRSILHVHDQDSSPLSAIL